MGSADGSASSSSRESPVNKLGASKGDWLKRLSPAEL